MTIGIAYDLWSNIISWSSADTLKDLSRASPLFDEVIFKSDLKAFHDDRGCYILSPTDKVIRLYSGKKYRINLCDTNNTSIPRNIRYERYYIPGYRLKYDNQSRVGILFNNDPILVFRDFINSDYYNIATVHKRISEDISYIDFKTKIAVSCCKEYSTYAYESFEILFDGHWK